MKIRDCAWMLFILAGLLGQAVRGAEPANLVTGEFLSSGDGVVAGKPFTVGILLKMAPGWHIYWKNAGDAGDPPHFTFNLPSGYSVSDVRFPLPMKFVQAANIVGYGYKDSALFMATVTPPGQLASGTQTLGVKVNWLCCQEVCKTGTSTLELSLPVKTEVAEANREIFRKAETLLPLAAPPVEVVGIVPEVEMLTATSANFRLAIQWRQRPVVVEIFPEEMENLDVQDLDMVGEGSISTVMIKCRVLTGQTLKSKELPLLVTYQDASGRHGFYTKLDVQALQSGKP